MKKQIQFAIITAAFSIITGHLIAQVSVNTDNTQADPSAMLDVKSTTKGLLAPRMTQNQIALIAAPANGLIVYCMTDDKFYAYVASSHCWKEILYGSATIGLITVPIFSTSSITDITTTTATSGGNVTSDGGASVIARGVCWGTSTNPTISDSHTTDGNGTGVFVSSLTGLTANTPYYVRAYATNSVGTAYGNQLNFRTACASYAPVSVSITPSANPSCIGTFVIFTAVPTNGGSAPVYSWFINGTTVGTNSNIFTFIPSEGDVLNCTLSSNAECVSGNPATSPPIVMTVTSSAFSPTSGTHVPSLTQIVWNWNIVSNATGYKWNTVNDYASAIDTGTATTSVLS